MLQGVRGDRRPWVHLTSHSTPGRTVLWLDMGRGILYNTGMFYLAFLYQSLNRILDCLALAKVCTLLSAFLVIDLLIEKHVIILFLCVLFNIHRKDCSSHI